MTGPRLRVGQGFDVHPWSDDPGRSLVLGGVTMPGGCGLQGHSDADVVAHACIDALLGAASLGDIGQFFPDSDPSLAGADSLQLLARAVAAVQVEGWIVTNIDCTVVLDQPKIAPIREQMQHNLSAVVGGPVTIKGKRTEGLDSLREGVRCWAVALLEMSSPAESAHEATS